MNANIVLPSQVKSESPPTKRRKTIPTIQQILPGQLISSEPGYLR